MSSLFSDSAVGRLADRKRGRAEGCVRDPLPRAV